MDEKYALKLDRIVFIGRTYFEYMRMFDLDESDLKRGTVLDCAAGPSSFAAEANQAGINVTACDLLYGASVGHLAKRGKEDITHVFDSFDEVSHLYTWKHYRNVDEVVALRHMALDLFLRDFPVGLAEGRYVRLELPRLPFPDKVFSLVLSGHFLFLYGDRLDLDFHLSCLKELVRVSLAEVRIFPLQGLDAKPYPHMNDVLSCLETEGIEAEMVKVPFELQRGSNRLLRLRRKLN